MRKIRGWIFLILSIIPLMLGMFFVAPTTLNGGGGGENFFFKKKIKKIPLNYLTLLKK